MESAQYSSWSELFKIHCKAFQVYDHLSTRKPHSTTTSSSKTPVTPNPDSKTEEPVTPKPDTKTDEDWERIDSIVLQWIYGTISSDLMHTILKKDTTASAAWATLADIFQDNKIVRGIHLNNKLSNTRLDNFPNASAYCQELKMLSDQLANVDGPIDDTKLVMQLITGLNEQYESFATLLANAKPFPTFYEARSQLIYEADRKAQYAAASATAANTALLASIKSASSGNNNTDYRGENRHDNSSDRYRGEQRSRGGRQHRGRGRGRSGWGRGRGST
ncbi:uncharacterized protein LOC143581542 [Bidens hawaiensis]|uniref:uncharacterized protein LOC143581542 n=1 Tax=Bidens hawaiensis TaxID=980011 RepID=UPI0040498915